jgi:hypothetical protein
VELPQERLVWDWMVVFELVGLELGQSQELLVLEDFVLAGVQPLGLRFQWAGLVD